MAIPDYQRLMLPVLELFADGRGSIKACLADLIRRFDISEEEAAELIPSGRVTMLANRAHWARTYMSKAGLLRSPRRNYHELTEAGRRLLASRPDRLDNRVLAEFEGFEEWRLRSRSGHADVENRANKDLERPAVSPESAATPDDRIASAVAEIEANLADDLLSRLVDGTPGFFEKAVIQLLVAMGYGRGREGASRRLGRSGDGGIDGVIDEDTLGLDAVYVQAKRYGPENMVGRPAIQQFVGSLTGEGASKGVFVTTSGFTSDARRYVEKIAQRIVLVDGQRFARLMIAHGVGVRAIETITLSEIDENFFAED